MAEANVWVSRLVTSALVLWSACGKDPSAIGSDDDGEGGPSDAAVRDAAKPPPTTDTCPPGNAYCQRDAGRPMQVCANVPIDLDPVGVNVMLAIDGSASMAPHWQRIRDAVGRLRDAHPDAQFGVHVFWGKIQQSFEDARQKANWCGGTDQKFLDVGPNTSQQLTDLMGDTAPGPGFFGIWETSPVIDPLDYYLTNATKLTDPTRTNYLVMISDGNDNCFGSVYSNQQDKLLAYEKISVELGKRNIRVLPIGFDAASASTWNGSYFTTPPSTNTEVLATLLKYGGTGLTEVPKVENPEQFTDVLDQVGLRVRSCRFAIPDTTDAGKVNPFELSFALNGVEVARDRTNTNGWNFVGDDIQQVELFGDACAGLRAGAALSSQKTCAEKTCGSAALEVQTKPRAVLYALDSSASRIDCADGTLDCLLTVGQTNRSSLTFWEVVEHAVGQSLVQPINDDIEFGLQFFPSKYQTALSCDVAGMPEVTPAPGAQITIMSQMLEKLPLGMTPLVAALESVAANPGRLAEADVQGALVMLTDGGDNCTDTAQDDVVARLGAAAKSLLDKNVKTYVVRYGAADGKTAEQEAQLRAIVANGGTARSDPADMTLTPYVDATDASQLEGALAELSNKLASCEIDVGPQSDDADKQNANLYLNGVAIPQQAHGKDDGWSWKDAMQSAIELHGPACEEFKTSRKSSVIVEFGCAPITVL